tara:strand:+ start:114626 stop:115078 length:453 start_codon:yes stop_codon:yes gene_type:complete
METKTILPGFDMPDKGNDLVWGQIEPKAAEPVDNTPIGQLMYAITRMLRAGYTRKEMVGPLFRHFEKAGFDIKITTIETVLKKTQGLIAKANQLNPNDYSTEAKYNTAIQAIDPSVTKAMSNDWIANLKDFFGVSTYSALQGKMPKPDLN